MIRINNKLVSGMKGTLIRSFARYIIFIITFSFGGHLSIGAQNELQATVFSKNLNERLKYVIISSKNSEKTYLTNPEGIFHIPYISDTDTLIFSLPGYNSVNKSVSDIKLEREVLMTDFGLHRSEFMPKITSSSLLLFIRNAAEKLRKKPALNSQAYLEYSSYSGNTDFEFSRFYYNVTIQGSKVLNMNLKHGRIGLVPNHLDLNVLAPSKSLIKQAPVQNSKLFPANPLQLIPDQNAENLWNFEMVSHSSSDKTIQINFTPKERNNGSLFEGEIWLDTVSFNIIKLALKIKNAVLHPFVGNPTDTINNVGIELDYHFSNASEIDNKLIYIHYTYAFDYTKNKSISVVSDRIMNEGLIHFYNYKETFFIPELSPNSQYDDHLKSGMMPFDSIFWKYNIGTDLTLRQLERISNIAKNGVLVNYNLGKKEKLLEKSLFEQNNIVWNKDKYLDLDRDMKLNTLQCELGIYIYCDINKYNDTIFFNTMTILDRLNTKFNLEYNKQNLVFQNIYFDLCEIIRLNLDEKLEKLSRDEDILIACEVAMKDLKSMTDKLKSETSIGQNIDKLKKWNDLVYNRTGTDNFKIFDLKYKPKKNK